MRVRVVAIRYEALDVLSYVLGSLESAQLPAFTPGSHVDLCLPSALIRSYSLSNGLGDEGLYRLTVQKDATSRGGSRYMHEQLRVGQELDISTPRNNFELYEYTPLSVFVAGGIGITPFVPMMACLNALGRRWRLHYCVRTRERAAFLQEIAQLQAAGYGEALLNFDAEPGGVMFDLNGMIASLPDQSHVYCCGPTRMLGAYRKAAEQLPAERVHFEYFGSDVKAATGRDYTVVLQKSGLEILVSARQTILQAVRNAGVAVESSCEEGICGACETKVISGEPDHRDMVLTEMQRLESKTMMICCSGSKSERLILDL